MRDQHVRGLCRSFVLLTSAALVSTGVLGGCEGTPSRTKQTVAVDPQADGFKALGYRLDWRGRGFVDRGERPLFMVPMGDVLAYQESGSTLSIVNSSTGEIRWTNQLAGSLTKFARPLRDGPVVRCSSETELHTLSLETGALVGRESFEKVITTRPAEAGELLIYGTAVGELMAHVRGMGLKLWGFQTTGAIERAPVMIGGVVGSVSQSGDVVFLEASSGSLTGRTRLFGGVATEAVTDGTLMFVACLDQSLYAINPEGGGIAWRIRTDAPLRRQPSVIGGVVYAELPGRGLCAINAETGVIAWERDDVAGTAICTRGKNVLVWDGETARLIEPATGDTIESARIPDATLLVADGETDPAIYVSDDKGRIGKYLAR